MKQFKLFFATSLVVFFLIKISCSQTPASGGSSIPDVFVASTPCDEVLKIMFKIPSGTKCQLMKWNLTLYQDPKTSALSNYKLICVYGLPKQGTKDFMEGARTIELKGRWTMDKGTNENAEAVVYKLNADNSPISLSFRKADQNLLHLLDGNRRLMVGNGAWSYTLNRINPVTPSSAKIASQTASSPPIATGSSAIEIFDGRTPCSSDLRELNGISAAGCQIIKCRLSLYQDTTTHMPTTFQLQTIYVGKGDSLYTNTGKWVAHKGTKADPEAIVYQLKLDSAKPHGSLTFLKADDNILFFLDKDWNFMVGDGNCSYTLNRIRK